MDKMLEDIFSKYLIEKRERCPSLGHDVDQLNVV